jgi:L-ascorbate metabolism protein UlaG (beta-lactamase superfamily)
MAGPKVLWLGHAGWRVECEYEGKSYVIYIDTWLGNPKIPDAFKDKTPEDADLILVTHGHFDHSASAPDLLKASKKEGCKIVCIFEVGEYYKSVSKAEASAVV